jgi:hypothetical protein
VTEFLFGSLAFLALLGWGATNALHAYARAMGHFREAQALEIEERVNARIDDRVSAVINRYQALKRAKQEGGEKPGPTVLDDATEAERERRRQNLSMTDTMPGGDGYPFDLGPLNEQPLGSVE